MAGWRYQSTISREAEFAPGQSAAEQLRTAIANKPRNIHVSVIRGLSACGGYDRNLRSRLVSATGSDYGSSRITPNESLTSSFSAFIGKNEEMVASAFS